jgi:hypothetical protein
MPAVTDRSSSPERCLRRTRRRAFGGVLLGAVLLQAVWIAVVPAFAGPDEIDHVFRAQGVSHGAFLPDRTTSAENARGSLTPVRRSVLEAASRQCTAAPIRHYYDCHAAATDGDGWAWVGSTAGRYNPAYYLVVGTIAHPFRGVAVDYVIRAATAGMCALILAWAAALWVRVGRPTLRRLAFLTALTPTLLFGTSVAAPNGVAFAAGVLVWVSGLVLLRDPAGRPRSASLGAAVGAIVLCNTHTTGVVWLILITVALVILSPSGALGLVRDRRRWPLIAVIAAGAVAAVIWTLVSGANSIGPGAATSTPDRPELGTLAQFEVVWLLQTIAFFQSRAQTVPPVVYVLWLLAVGVLLTRVLAARGRHMVAVIWVAVIAILAQTALSYVGFTTARYAWQGRYELPLTVGLALIPGLVEPRVSQVQRILVRCATAALVLGIGVSTWSVTHDNRDAVVRPWFDHTVAGPAVAGMIAAIGSFVMVWGLRERAEASE